MISERSDPTVILIGEILDVVQDTAIGVEPGEVVYPAWLGFVAVAEVDMGVVVGYYTSINQLVVDTSWLCRKEAMVGEMGRHTTIIRQLLQPQYNILLRSFFPCSSRDEGSADGFEFLVAIAPGRAALD